MEIALWSIATFLALHFILLLFVMSSEIVARTFGVPVERMVVGFGPTLWRTHFRSVEFRWALLPITSSIKTPDDSNLASMSPSELEDIEDDDGQPLRLSAIPRERRTIEGLSISAQGAFLLAGPASNALFGLLLLAVAISLPKSMLVVDGSATHSVTPSAVPGLAITDESATIESQFQLFQNTFMAYWYPPKFFAKDWGGYLGAAITSTVVAQQSFGGWLSCMGVLSLGLGIFNLLPLPIMNGGRLLLLLIQKATGPLPRPMLDQLATFSFGIVLMVALAIAIADYRFVRSLWH